MECKSVPGYVDARYLEAAGDLLRPLKSRSYESMRIGAGDTVLDVGCGPGLDTLAMAGLVGPAGRVLGVDADASMVAAANENARRAGLSDRVRHERADAAALPLDSDRFDACRSERLFIHLADPLRALAEMARVTRPGGRVVVVDSDWGSLSVDTTRTEVERQLARFRAERLLNNGYSGRQLFRLFKSCGLLDVEVQIWPVAITGDAGLLRDLTKLDEVERLAWEAGVVAAEELDAWRAELTLAERQGIFFGSMSLVLAAGRKPD